MTDVQLVKFEPSELLICDELLLADSMLKSYCDFITDDNLEDNEPLIKSDDEDISSEDNHRNSNNRHNPNDSGVYDLDLRKQIVLVRSCLADVIYSIHCLGLWCTRRIVKLYITELARILQANKNDGEHRPGSDLISSAVTMMQCFSSRLDGLINHSNSVQDFDDILKHGSSHQLRTLLHYIKDHEPPTTGTWPVCIVHVHRKVVAKAIALWLREVSSEFKDYSFIKANYIVGSSRKHRNRMAVDNFDLHHEASIRDFRFGKCNTLIISSMNERCADMLRCNLVVSFDFPLHYSDYAQARLNCRNDSSKYIIFMNSFLGDNLEEKALKFINMEKIINSSGKRDTLEPQEMDLLKSMEKDYPPYPQITRNARNSPATLLRGISIINKYCAKLPSDSFTKLAPDIVVNEIEIANSNEKQFSCSIRLPINSPVRQAIYGSPAKTKGIAIRIAAFVTCQVLHKANELDDNMLPIKKDSMKALTSSVKDPSRKTSSQFNNPSAGPNNKSLGSTKHRQYYKKRIATVFSGHKVTEGISCYLYKFKMVLTCPIPDEQNRRGRRIIDPSETNRDYAIICANRLPKICAFPVFTRSGEVMISIECVQDNFQLSQSQVQNLRTFHEYTFSKVLRLEKYPSMFDPEHSPFTVLLAPVINDTANKSSPITEIDWDFVQKIVTSNHESFVPSVEERKKFKFNYDDYVDAVVIPWYRLVDRQQFAYYVAEICTNMNPKSPFPDETSGFDTFVEYYKSKYDIVIHNTEQPVLDVDHTSARLNLLTPRYVNRKGKTLPSSTAKTRRESRESLDRKQLLIPELCTIHPFPASFWRKAVCLPAIFYRLNSLFLAEELRRNVAAVIKVGFVEPPSDFAWPDLNFGWSLKDVICSQSAENSDYLDGLTSPEVKNLSSTKASKGAARSGVEKLRDSKKQPDPVSSNKLPDFTSDGPIGDFVIDEFDPSKLNIPDIPLDAPPDEWMNIKLISSSNTAGSNLKTGWDQELEQRDLLLHHTSDVTWDDCEMEFDGEITERPPEMRCGSPSNFEPSNNVSIDSYSNFSLRNFDGNTSKTVQFSDVHQNVHEVNGNTDNDDDDEDEEEEEYSSNLKHQDSVLKSIEDCPLNNVVDSDSSWDNISEEEYNDEEDTNTCLYDEWRDEKVKRQSFLRELFVPYLKTINNIALHNDTELYYNELMSAMRDTSESNDNINNDAIMVKLKNGQYIKMIERIQPISAYESPCNLLDTLLRNHFGDLKEIKRGQFPEKFILWRGIFSKIAQQIERTLTKESDLFKNNEVSFISTDDTPLDLNLQAQPTFGQLLPNRDQSEEVWSDEEWKNIRFDPTRAEVASTGPGPSIILQALTMSNASDGINLERLETVGDSFLKYSITAYLYCMFPKLHEGKLSYLRSTEISNANLYQLGREKNLGEIMSATKFEPNDNWLPPGYTVADTSSNSSHENSCEVNENMPPELAEVKQKRARHKKKEIDKALAEVPYDLLRQHSIPDKSIADCVEALIGAYLTASGSRAALLFMQWLGLRVVPPTFALEEDLIKSDTEETGIWRWLDIPPSPLIFSAPSHDDRMPDELRIKQTPEDLKQSAMDELHRLYHENDMMRFEQEIRYEFKDKAYLVQAFTHNSYYENHVTDCHQRLEFLGDALLDYLITRYLFEDPRCHSPGTLTDLRSALVNNTFFASLAVKYNFYKYLMFKSDELVHAIEELVKKFRFNTKDTITKGYTLLIGEGESEYAEDIEVPKALGDVFESVAGAIYLDSGMSLDQVWKVYFEMMKPEIEYFSRNVPKSPIRELLESKPQNVRFSPSELAPDKKHRVTAEVFGLGRFTGVGRSKHSAKSTAAKRALRMLNIRKHAKIEIQESSEEEC